ncbi:MAG: SURF1 family protein [Burkholderiales bacterium]
MATAAVMRNDGPEAPARRSAVVPTLAAGVCIALFVSAGVWQHDRMQQKLALRAQLDAASAHPATALPDAGEFPGWRYRPVAIEGAFDAAHQVLLDNRVHEGRAGYEVVAPFVLRDGRVVVVDRGWVPQGATRADLPVAPPPAGPLTLQGRVNLPPVYVELARDAAPGVVWQNLDMQRFAQHAGHALLPVVVEQTAPAADGDTLVRTRPAPDFGVDTHRIYMVQWFIFAAMVAGLWGYFTWKRLR